MKQSVEDAKKNARQLLDKVINAQRTKQRQELETLKRSVCAEVLSEASLIRHGPLCAYAFFCGFSHPTIPAMPNLAGDQSRVDDYRALPGLFFYRRLTDRIPPSRAPMKAPGIMSDADALR